MNNPFLAILFRMKYITRWSLMYNMQKESLSEHTVECALILHLLAVIGNKHFGKSYNAERLVMYALFHDVTEILTGDLPTPVKYYSEDSKAAYKAIEKTAANKLLSYLPDDLKEDYSDFLLFENISDNEKHLLKTADKICAYIKAKQEVAAGNKEFIAAENKIQTELQKNKSEELQHFLTFCLDSFMMSIDELNGVL